MKKILGLDLGTNSIGWAVVNANKDENNHSFIPEEIDRAGSRIIPMDAAQLGEFEKGNSISQTKERTSFRGTRRLRERNLLRRERLHRILNLMGFLPEHFSQKLDKYGKFTDESEPKLAWRKDKTGKFEFIFKDSFEEMLVDFRQQQPLLFAEDNKVPYDWTIYYLRKKALSKKITKEELAWILLNFNQKRGYYQLREEDEEQKKNQLVEFYALKVTSVEDSGEKKKGDVWYNVHLENGWIYRRSSKYPLEWVGKTKEFIITTDLNEDGTPKKDKDGNIKRSFRAPKEDDWTLVKKKTELDIDNYIKTSNKTVGAYIYDNLLKNPNQKIKGKLVRTIERKYYREELRLILEKQKEFHSELNDRELYGKCLNELYAINQAHRNTVVNRDFTYLFIDDIIFYQRPLKSKKSLIDDCPYESGFDKEGKEHPIKCIAKTNPIYQEFRLWQFISNLRIYQKERSISISDRQLDLFSSSVTEKTKLETDVDVTNEFLKSEEDLVALFDWLNDRKEIEQEVLLNSYFKIKRPKGKEYPYRWNYVEKKYPCNKTRALILSRLGKANLNLQLLTKEFEYALWHILYSVEDNIEIEKALRSFATKQQLANTDSFVDAFKKCPPFKKEYGAYSEKATKKLLSLMRLGKYWDEKAIDTKTRQRIEKILTGEYDEKIQNRVREKAIVLSNINQFRGLPIWLACYIVYDRHSEAKEIEKWKSPNDIDNYLKHFKQHSLRNPIVEKVITETLRTVRDIWKEVGQIDEIHVELGRDMKNPADKRARMTQQVLDNENANLRIKALLAEFVNPEYKIENVRPYSPSQQDILRIYEEGVLTASTDKDLNENLPYISEADKNELTVKDILAKFKESDVKKRPKNSEILRYKLWLEQKYRSPYTGEIIPLSKLFTPDYEIEHIIPQSRYFDDSFSNKVICESDINKLKDNQLGYEFISKHHGEKVQLTGGKIIEILSVEAYEALVKKDYGQNRPKMTKLLMSDIPDKFIERQLNDSRYISKVVKTLLSNIVREKDENGEYEQEAISKNVIVCNGSVTDRLKKDWGMNDVWNQIVLPRFERLNQLTGRNVFTTESNGHIIPSIPLELQKGFNKKRIDHRHHAMDAIVIACTTRNHVNLLNNESARAENKTNRYQLSHILRRYEKVVIDGKERDVPKEFLLPWKTFPQDAYSVLNDIVVSFKQNLRVINKTTNRYESYKDENGNIRVGKDGKPKKELINQEKGDSWAIRKSMHKDTVYGLVSLRKIKDVRLSEVLKNPKSIVDKELKNKIVELQAKYFDEKKIKKYFEDNKDIWSEVNLAKISIYYYTNVTDPEKEMFFATRKALDDSFDKKRIEESVTDTGIQKILFKHLILKSRLRFDSEIEVSINGMIEQKLGEEAKLTNDDITRVLSNEKNKFYGKDGKEIENNIQEIKEKCLIILKKWNEKESAKIEIVNHPELAFSADGIDELNRNIKDLNEGKNHHPIQKVRVYEKAEKYAVGEKGNKKNKYVEADKGTNLYFAVYQSKSIDKETGMEKTTRSYATVPLNIAIECQKTAGKNWKTELDSVLKKRKYISEDASLYFILSPNDLVYLPTDEELKNGRINKLLDKSRIYKMVSCTGNEGHFIPAFVANPIIQTLELGSNNKAQRAWTNEMIKEICLPIKTDRLGNIEII